MKNIIYKFFEYVSDLGCHSPYVLTLIFFGVVCILTGFNISLSAFILMLIGALVVDMKLSSVV